MIHCVITMVWIMILWIGIESTRVSGKLGPEGCDAGWTHYNYYCYLAVGAHTHYDSAKAICILKDAMLASLWTDGERMFVNDLVQNLDAIHRSAWLGVGEVKGQWMWLDGSGEVQSLFKELPRANGDDCGFLTPGGALQFVDCDIVMSAFVCKKPLDIVYVPDTANITESGVYFQEDTTETLFERLRPPLLDKVVINMTSSSYMATIEVSRETDCAYRCYTLDDCKTFSIVCKSSTKCKLWYCKLLSGIDIQ